MSSRSEHLRSCLGCKFVQRAKEFSQRGCPNCEAILEMMQDTDQVIRCTTSNYDGLIALIKPEESWVAKWQRIEKRVPGLYAVKTEGSACDYQVSCICTFEKIHFDPSKNEEASV